jgi:hypothetical protein
MTDGSDEFFRQFQPLQVCQLIEIRYVKNAHMSNLPKNWLAGKRLCVSGLFEMISF